MIICLLIFVINSTVEKLVAKTVILKVFGLHFLKFSIFSSSNFKFLKEFTLNQY